MVLSGLLEICERERERERESQWRRVNVLSHVGWSFLLLGSEERECVLSHWLVCSSAGQWGSEKRGREIVSVAFYVAPGW